MQVEFSGWNFSLGEGRLSCLSDIFKRLPPEGVHVTD